MHISEAIRIIDETGSFAPFKLLIAKADGSLREIYALKRNREKIEGSHRATTGSAFGYSLSAKYSLLINEITGLRSKPVNTPMGEVQVITEEPKHVYHRSASRLKPKSIRIFSILEFNNQKTYAG